MLKGGVNCGCFIETKFIMLLSPRWRNKEWVSVDHLKAVAKLIRFIVIPY